MVIEVVARVDVKSSLLDVVLIVVGMGNRGVMLKTCSRQVNAEPNAFGTENRIGNVEDPLGLGQRTKVDCRSSKKAGQWSCVGAWTKRGE